MNRNPVLPSWLILTLVGLFLFLTSLSSSGFFHPDEYFSVLNFSFTKLGILSPQDLTWEYREAMRPWLQPGLYAMIAQLYLKFFSFDPFVLSILFRLFNSALAFWVIALWWRWACQHYSPSKARRWISGFFFIWIFPFMMVRTSSDALSTTVLYFGIYLFVNRKNSLSPLLLSGLTLGLAISLRHQLAVMVFFFALWWILFKKEERSRIPIVFFTFLLGIGAGVVADYWGYGRWEFTAYNSLSQNLLQGKMDKFGLEPWWAYFSMGTKTLGPVSWFLFLGPVLFVVKNPKHLVSFLFLPFFLFHLFLGHKELRFLYPLAPLAWWMCLETIPFLYTLLRPFVGCLLAINLFLCLRPAWTPISVYSHLWKTPQMTDLFLYSPPGHPNYLELKAWVRPNLKVHSIETIASAPEKESFHVLVFRNQDRVAWINEATCTEEFSSYPLWVLHLNYFRWVDRSSFWVLLNCKRSYPPAEGSI